MSELIIETSDASPRPALSGDTADLLAFLSFAAAERYGSTHPLSAAARLLRQQHGVDTRPFWDFDAAEAEDEDDRKELARIWQTGGPLAEACAAAAAVIRADAQLAALTREFPALPGLLEDLAAIALAAERRAAKVRVTYRL